MTTGLLIRGQIGHLSFSGSSGPSLLPLLLGPVRRLRRLSGLRRRALLLRFEVGSPPLEFFRYVHEMKAARIIPPEILCQT
jgi:hypothetical protein